MSTKAEAGRVETPACLQGFALRPVAFVIVKMTPLAAEASAPPSSCTNKTPS